MPVILIMRELQFMTLAEEVLKTGTDRSTGTAGT